MGGKAVWLQATSGGARGVCSDSKEWKRNPKPKQKEKKSGTSDTVAPLIITHDELRVGADSRTSCVRTKTQSNTRARHSKAEM